MDYPLWDLPFGGGVLIGVVAILHVVVSHFAVGGGLLIAVVETLAVRRGDPALRALARRSTTMLVLVSTVFGAISGVGIWFTIGLVHPAATSTLIHLFVWAWAIEWAFFLLEVVTALAYHATWEKVSPRTHLFLIWVYAFAAFMSLVVIQGILAFMLTPGRWLETRSVWDAFFNPSYLPGLVLRTGVCLLLAGAYLGLAAMREKDCDARSRAFRLLGVTGLAGGVLAYAGLRAWEAALPPEATALFLGAKPLLAGLGATRTLVLSALAVSLVLALLAAFLPRLSNWGFAVVALVAGFAVLGGYERLREGARKPFVIRGHMFSNGVLVSEIEKLNREGILSKAVWAARLPGGGTAGTGQAVFRAQCASCHTMDRTLGIRKIAAPLDADLATTLLGAMRDDGREWAARPPGKPGYPFMPPFVGTDAELAALAEWLVSLSGPADGASAPAGGSRAVAEARRAR